MKNKKGFIVPLLIIIGILVVGGGVYVYKKNKKISVTENTKSLQTSQEPQSASQTVGWKTYTNEKDGFQFQYPPSFTLSTTPDSYWKQAFPGQYSYRYFKLTDAIRNCYIGPVAASEDYEGNIKHTSKIIKNADGSDVSVSYNKDNNNKLITVSPYIIIPSPQYTLSFTLTDLHNPRVTPVSQSCVKDFETMISTFKFIK